MCSLLSSLFSLLLAFFHPARGRGEGKAISTAYARWILTTQSRSTLKMQRFEPSIDHALGGSKVYLRVGPPQAASFGDLWRPLGVSLLSSLFSLLSSLSSLMSSLFSPLSLLFSLLSSLFSLLSDFFPVGSVFCFLLSLFLPFALGPEMSLQKSQERAVWCIKGFVCFRRSNPSLDS